MGTTSREVFCLHDNDVQKEGAGEIVRIKFLSEKQAKEIAELCGNTEKGMKPIQDGMELVEFLQGMFPVEGKEAKVLLEYLDGHGYMLAGEGGGLYRGDLCKDPDSICWEKYSIGDAIEAACEWNCEMLLLSQNEKQDSSGDYKLWHEMHEELQKDEEILGRLFGRTERGIENSSRAAGLAGVSPELKQSAGRSR